MSIFYEIEFAKYILPYRYDYYQIHQPVCQEHAGLPEIHPAIKGQTHSRLFREGKY